MDSLSSHPSHLPRSLMRLFALLGFFSVFFWGICFFVSSWKEPLQIAVAGYFSPWTKQVSSEQIIRVGSHRQDNEMVLQDPKVDASLLQWTLKGNEANRWVLLENRSSHQTISLFRKENPTQKIDVNRIELKNKSQFQVWIPKEQIPLGMDWCSPATVLGVLRKHKITKKAVLQSLTFEIQTKIFPFRFWNQELILSDVTGKKMTLWESHSYQVPSALGEKVEYRNNQWMLRKSGRWEKINQELTWGNPKKTLSLQRVPKITTQRQYSMRLGTSSCWVPLRQEAFPQGVALSSSARLLFSKKRLFLQHLGHANSKIVSRSSDGESRKLGEIELHSGDYLSFGKNTYQMTLRSDGVQLFYAKRPSQRSFLFFFRWFPTFHYSHRNALPQKQSLVVTGGEGQTPGSVYWKTSFSSMFHSKGYSLYRPFSPFFRVQSLRRSKEIQVDAMGSAPLTLADHSGKWILPSFTQPKKMKVDAFLLYGKRMYFRVFQPSFQGLAGILGILWILMSGTVVVMFYSFGRKGKLRFVFLSLPVQVPSWLNVLARKVPFLLVPIALFLNGLGLFVLAKLSLSSMALNNHAFLSRQFFWSFVGMALLVFSTLFLPQLWASWQERKQKKKAQQIQIEVSQRFFPAFSFRKASFFVSVFGALGVVFAILMKQSIWVPVFLCGGILFSFLEYSLRSAWRDPEQQKKAKPFLLTLFFLSFVPLLGFFVPFAVHNRLFLKIPLLGTVKLSDFAILPAISFFTMAFYEEVFDIQKYRSFREHSSKIIFEGESSFQGRLLGAFRVSFSYLFLLVVIAFLYTMQGDLGPGLILTLCFSLYLLFSFFRLGSDKGTTYGNLMRIGIVFLGIFTLLFLPDFVAWLFPTFSGENTELLKIRERISLWNQPWQFLVGEQILQNRWALAGTNDSFQWFNNLHSDFVLTAVVRIASGWMGGFVIFLVCGLPFLSILWSWALQPPSQKEDSLEQEKRKKELYKRSFYIALGGLFLFSQSAVHISSVLGISPMTGVTLPWISSGGTSVVVCYLVCAVMLVAGSIVEKEP